MLLTSSVGFKKDTSWLSYMSYVNTTNSDYSSLAGTIINFPAFDLKGFQAFRKNMKWIKHIILHIIKLKFHTYIV
jgi:hypothetical protein